MVSRALAIGLLAIGLSGCSSLDTQSRFELLSQHPGFPLVWPSADVPRFQYLGDIIGEQNFSAEFVEKSQGARFWQWLIGEQEVQPRGLQRPQGLALDVEGRLYVTDVGQAAVLMFDRHHNRFAQWGPQQGRGFRSPVGIAIRQNALLIADSEAGCLWEIDRFSGEPLRQYQFPQIPQPVGLAWAEDRQQWFISDAAAHKVHTLDANLVYQGELTTGVQLNRPTFLAYQHGALLIADTLDAKVHRLSLDSGALLSIGQRGDRVGNLNRPKGVAFDRSGRIYVIESYFDHLLVFNDAGELLLPIGGSGSEPGNFMLPSGIVIDNQNRVYISDMLNGRVSVFQYLGKD